MQARTCHQENPAYFNAISYAEGEDISTLPRIFEENINLSVMRRQLNEDVLSGVKAQLQADRPLYFNWFGPPGDELRSKLTQQLHDAEACSALIEDVVTLADAIAFLFETDTIGLRLRCLESAMCPRFHCDNIPVRLVATYHGPGSEWLPEWAVNRQGLGAPHPEKPEIVIDSDAVQQLQVGDLALLKGSGWIGNEAHGLVHRSPNLPAGSRRLLLTIDPA